MSIAGKLKKAYDRNFRKVFFTMGTVLIMVLIVKVMTFSVKEGGEALNYQKYFNEHYKIFSLQLPEQLDFAGEPVPMEDLDVREKLDRELLVNTYWQSHSLLYHKRANRWFPVIEPILKEEGVPTDFRYLALIESGLKNVVSPAGATGFWQFMEGTAKEYGLEVNEYVDERYHVEKATRAACKYLKKAHKKYDSWTLAAASFNVGMEGLDRRIREQKTGNYYDLFLNRETARYIYRVLAVKEILENSADYGFHIRPRDLYEPYKTRTVRVDSTIGDLTVFAHDHGVDHKVLKLLNPWLRKNKLPVKDQKSYRIDLPTETMKKERLKKKGDRSDTVPFKGDIPVSDTAESSPPDKRKGEG